MQLSNNDTRVNLSQIWVHLLGNFIFRLALIYPVSIFPLKRRLWPTLKIGLEVNVF